MPTALLAQQVAFSAFPYRKHVYVYVDPHRFLSADDSQLEQRGDSLFYLKIAIIDPFQKL
jgi:hypothetical protein